MPAPYEQFRARDLVLALAAKLAGAAAGIDRVRIMHVCGTHEHELRRFALRQLLPPNVELIAGPGCPVCITPAAAIITARRLALADGKRILAAYGDVLRVPTTEGSLLDARRDGGDIRLIYGPPDAVRLARENPDRTVIFFSVGFETTAAPVAAMLKTDLPGNFFIHACHRYVPSAVEAIVAQDTERDLAGFLLPGHACVITGAVAYRYLADAWGRAAAVAGFEPVDILRGVLSILEMIRDGRAEVGNCYRRAVRDLGNRRAQAFIGEVFDRFDAPWRGIGILPRTGLALKAGFERLDALRHFGIEEAEAEDLMPGCICHLVMMGKRRPADCPLFGAACTPTNPRGPCMVSREGTCYAWFSFGEVPDGG